jgi:hypothetical protein
MKSDELFGHMTFGHYDGANHVAESRDDWMSVQLADGISVELITPRLRLSIS